MKFVDNIFLEVIAGNGGNGIISFLKELHRPFGGPDGGNGGNGGNIFVKANNNLNTLFHLANKKIIKAGSGGNGAGNNCQGSQGKNFTIEVPLGTIIKNEQNQIIFNITDINKTYLLAAGGKGGKGNAAFKTGQIKAPKICENGDLGQAIKIHMELKLMANIGVIGYPNSGKSTLVSILSKAKPKIGDFPFTSLTPTLGVVSKHYDNFVIADIPGLIKGASKGKGLGHQFLKHVERCNSLIHLLSAEENNPKKLYQKYLDINLELKNFSHNLYLKPQIVTLNKSDLLNEKQISKIQSFFKEKKLQLIFISAINKENLDKLINICFQHIKDYNLAVFENKDTSIKTISAKDVFLPSEINIYKKQNVWYVQSAKAKILVEKIPLLNKDCYTLLNKKLEKLGIFKEIKKHNIKDGEEIDIYGYTFEWREKK